MGSVPLGVGSGCLFSDMFQSYGGAGLQDMTWEQRMDVLSYLLAKINQGKPVTAAAAASSRFTNFAFVLFVDQSHLFTVICDEQTDARAATGGVARPSYNLCRVFNGARRVLILYLRSKPNRCEEKSVSGLLYFYL